MVISRTTNKLADWTKKRIAYYACGNWKNKGTTVCNGNTIRADKANEYVFSKLSELLEVYEDEIITKEEFKVRKYELMQRFKALEEEKAPLLVTLSDDVSEELPYEFIKSILENFSKVLTKSSTREQPKKLLHMIIF